MSAGERVTCETCPVCGLSAAVGWHSGSLVEADCPSGCRLTAADFAGRGPNGLRSIAPVSLTGDGLSRSSVPTPSQLRRGTVGAVMTRCPRCDSTRVDGHWRADMARLALIDEWKCLEIDCGYRWDTSLTYAQLPDSDAVQARTDGQR